MKEKDGKNSHAHTLACVRLEKVYKCEPQNKYTKGYAQSSDTNKVENNFCFRSHKIAIAKQCFGRLVTQPFNRKRSEQKINKNTSEIAKDLWCLYGECEKDTIEKYDHDVCKARNFKVFTLRHTHMHTPLHARTHVWSIR